MIFFASFCCFRDFLLEILKLKKKIYDYVHWNVWTNIKTLFARNTIFKKRIPNMRFYLNNLYFGSNFVFFGTAIGRFSQCFFLIFRRRPTMLAKIFTHPPPTPPPCCVNFSALSLGSVKPYQYHKFHD